MGASQTAWLGVAYAVCLTTAFNYSVLSWVNKQTTPTTAAVTTPIQPIAATLFSWAILGVGPKKSQVAGAVAIFTGLLLYITARSQEGETKALLSYPAAEKKAAL